MSVFYNPTTRKPQAWVMVLIVLVPIFLAVVTWFYGQGEIEKKKSKQIQQVEEDIFKKL